MVLDLKKYYGKNEILAKVLFDFIENSKNGNGAFELDLKDESKIDKSDGMIIGLHTDWGGGKTTLIDELYFNYLKPNQEKYIEEVKEYKFEKEKITKLFRNNEKVLSNHYFVQKINAWEFNKEKKEDLWMSIISYFYIRVVETYKDELKNEKDFKSLVGKLTLSNLATVTNKLTGAVLPQFSFFTEKLEEFTKEIEKNDPTIGLDKLKDNISLYYSIKQDFKEVLKNNNISSKVKKFILIIDDLDRCSPKEVVNLLDALKIFLDIPNLIVIVAVDRRHIEKGIYEVYNKEQENNENLSKLHKGKYLVNPDEYLEKIIHLPVDLFLFDDDFKDPSKILGADLQKTLANYDFKNEYKKYEYIVNLGLSNNPRKNLRFKRLFKFYFYLFSKLGLFKDNESENIDFYIFILVLKTEWGDYFQELIKKPTLLYYPYNYVNDGKSISDLLIKYSKIFYNKSLESLNTYEELKLKKFITFIINFSYSSENKILDKDAGHIITFDRVLLYFYSFILGIDCFEKFVEIGNKLSVKPIIDLEIFGTDSDKDFKKSYIDSLKKIYKLEESLNNYDELRGDFLPEYEKKVLDNIFSDLKIKDIDRVKSCVDFIDKDGNDIFKNPENNKLGDKEQNNEIIFNENLKFIKNESELFNNNTEILDNAFPHYIKMITGIDTIQNAKEIDPKRFILGSKLFFDNILISKFNELSKIDINKDTKLNKETKFIDLINKEILNYNEDGLGLGHILNELKNNERRTLFGELINQMSFAKGGPSIGGMTGATDYTQLEALVIEGIEDMNILDEWQKKLKNTIFVESGISGVKHVMKFKEMIEFLHKNIKDENLLKKLNRLEKRLIYIFSHFWSFQKIDLYIPYYGTSKKGLKLLGLWEDIYGNLDNSLNNYITFCIAFNDYKEKHIKSLGTKFEKELDEYITNIPYNLETLFKGSDIKVDKEYAKEFIKVKIIEHRLIRLVEFNEKQEETTNQDTN